MGQEGFVLLPLPPVASNKESLVLFYYFEKLFREVLFKYKNKKNCFNNPIWKVLGKWAF